LLFIVLDNFDPHHDRTISEHVLRMHRYRSDENSERNQSAQSLHEVATFDQQNPSGEQQSIYVQYNQLLHGNQFNRSKQLFSTQFLKKYILYAKQRVHPTLSQEAAAYISKAYSDLRIKEDMKTLPVTPRTLDAMIRLTVAHAKCRLSHLATEEDAKAALNIMSYALYHEANSDHMNNKSDQQQQEGSQSHLTKRKHNPNDDSSVESKKQKRDDDESDPQNDVDDQDTEEPFSGSLDSSRVQEFGKHLFRFMTSKHLSEAPLSQIISQVNSASGMNFSSSEVKAILSQMENNGSLLFRNETVHLF